MSESPDIVPLKFIIFTQDDREFLPVPIHTLVSSMPGQVEAIILSPPMSTHGGRLTGLLRHLPVFGITGTAKMGSRVIWSRLGPKLGFKPKGRKHWSIESVGQEFGVPVHFVDDVNSEQMQHVLQKHPSDLLVSVSCPQILKPAVLKQFSHGGINVHSAPLPRYRGLMPAFWVLFHGEKSTSVTVHDLAEKLDNGDILLQSEVPIADGETWDSLLQKTKSEAGHALVKAIKLLEQGSVNRLPNRDEDSTYFGFPTYADAKKFRARGIRMF